MTTIRTADRRPSKNVNDVKNGKLEKTQQLSSHFYQRKKGGLVYVEIYPTSAIISEATAYEVR